MQKKAKHLIQGDKMVCPRCKKPHPIFSYIPEMVIEEYAHETVPIIKCPECRWRFAPAESRF